MASTAADPGLESIAEPKLRWRQLAEDGNVEISGRKSLGRLKTDVIDLYYIHRVDPTVPRLVARSSDQGCLISDFCSSGRGFALHCLQTPPRDAALALC
jgi:hypothetical protein